VLFLVGAGMVGSIADQIPLFKAFGSGLFVIGGIIMIGLGVLFFFVGRGLWKAKSWARIVVLIFVGLGILMSVISMIQGGIINNIPGLVIPSVIGGYLLFSKSVKKAFA
jgi:RsiW-degrading membrane proteinase PrsW (M82 family)